MKERTFNSLMPAYNENWAARVLNMKINSKRGPDLIDDKKAVEIKFKILYSSKKYTHKCWRVQEHQLKYNRNNPEIYWGLGFYIFNDEVKNVKRKSFSNIEKLVDYRELYLIKWDWMKQFSIYHHNGKTKSSEWDYFMRFPKFKFIPNVIYEKEVEGGKIFFTEGINPERFTINENPSQQNPYKDVPF
jgi:hypothetical protein